MNLRYQKYKSEINSIVFYLTLLYIEKNHKKKNVWLVFIYYILKNYDLYITYYILHFCNI